MTPTPDPRQLRDLFDAACELVGEEQSRFLERECAGQPELRSAIDRLLHADESARSSTFWQRPAIHAAVKQFAQIPDWLGSYRILERLGSGGMAIVYLAEGDYDGVLKRVAIKAIPFAFDREMVRRFQTERRILAALEHPYIARMLDAGTTAEGIPYLVMEFVDGLPLDRYCDDRILSLSARLNLFRSVCDAVAYAHRNLVVHRDLKPGNILVTAEGVPKLLDFGIARLLGEARGEATVAMMTPRYASPEQRAGRVITTASDIYSLGLILRELAAPELKGDLANVISMALHEEPEGRYESAADLSEDVRRVIEKYPVRAHPVTLGYRLRRFLARRPAEVAVMMILAVALLFTAVVAARQYSAADRRFREVREVANSLMFDVYDAIGDQPGTTKARAMIAERAQRYLDTLAKDRSNDSALKLELATAYRKLGDVLGRPFVANLGDIEGAKRNYQSAAALLEAGRSRGKQDAARLLALGDVYEKLARISDRKGLMPEAVEEAEKSVHAREQAAALDPAIESRLALVNGNLLLALCHMDFGKASQNPAELKLAQRIMALALEDAKRWSLENLANDDLHDLVAKAAEYLLYADSDLAAVSGEPLDQTEPLRLAELRLAELKPLYAREPLRYRRSWADSLSDLSRVLLAIGDGAGAEKAAREGLEQFEVIADTDRNNYEAARDVILAHFWTAKAIAAQHEDASSEFHSLLEAYETIHPRNPGDQPTGVLVESRDWLAAHALSAGDRGTALSLYRKNVAMLETASNATDLMQLAHEEELLGDMLAEDAPKAKECYIRAAEIWLKFPQEKFAARKGAEIASKLSAMK